MILSISGSQISPCIVAKARYALGLSNRKPRNTKTCSVTYWGIVVDYLGEQNRLNPNQIQIAKNRLDLIT